MQEMFEPDCKVVSIIGGILIHLLSFLYHLHLLPPYTFYSDPSCRLWFYSLGYIDGTRTDYRSSPPRTTLTQPTSNRRKTLQPGFQSTSLSSITPEPSLSPCIRIRLDNPHLSVGYILYGPYGFRRGCSGWVTSGCVIRLWGWEYYGSSVFSGSGIWILLLDLLKT